MRWTAPHHLILLTEQGSTSKTQIECEGKAIYEGRDRAGVLTFVPAFTERRGIYRNADLTYSALWIDPHLQMEWSGCAALSGLPVFANHSDTTLATLIRALRADVSAAQAPGQAYVEHLAALMLLRIAAMSGRVKVAARGGTLSARTVSRLTDYIDAHLADDLSLGDLAREAGMPVDTFARRFKTTTGLPPYAYMLERRIARAETLLSSRDSSVLGIALALGFSSQSHFTAAFRKLRGITPAAWRAQIIP